MNETVVVNADKLAALCQGVFLGLGLSPEHAGYAAHCLVQTNLWGVDSHGVIRLPIYAERLHNGAVNPAPAIRVERRFGGLARMNGDHGLGYIVGREAMATAISLATEHGLGSVAVRNSNHFGAAALFARQAAEAGMIGIAMSDTLPNMVGPGSRHAAVGNNPVAFAVPSFGGEPFVFDLSLSQVAGGKLLLAREKGEKIPLDWAVDRDGKPTDDPAAGFAGAFLPVGGHKGYGLALVVELLSGLLGGGAFLFDVGSMYKTPEAPSNTSHHMLAINPLALHEREDWTASFNKLRTTLKNVPMRDNGAPLIFPGELETACAARRSREGIPLPRSVRDELNATAARFAPGMTL